MKVRFPIACVLLLCVFACAQDYKWQKTLEMNGSGIMQGPPMNLRGSKWRVRYASKDSMPILVELCSADGSRKLELLRSTNKQGISGSRTVDFRGGYDKGFIRVQGSLNGWQLVFEQYVDDIRGWELTRLAKVAPAFEKLGVWSGDGGETSEIDVSVDAKCWRLSMKCLEQGRLKVDVIDGAGKTVSVVYMFAPGTTENWLYAPGEYKLRVSSVASSWTLEVDTLK